MRDFIKAVVRAFCPTCFCATPHLVLIQGPVCFVCRKSGRK